MGSFIGRACSLYLVVLPFLRSAPFGLLVALRLFLDAADKLVAPIGFCSRSTFQATPPRAVLK